MRDRRIHLCRNLSVDTTRCSRWLSLALLLCRSMEWEHRIGQKHFTMSAGEILAMLVFPIAYSGTKRSPRSILIMTSRGSVFMGLRQVVRTHWARCCFILNFTRFRFQLLDVTTTAWTRSGGTNNGWVG